MDIKEEYYLSKYEELKVLSNTEKCKTILVRNIDTGELAIKKEMGLPAYNIYSVLKNINSINLAAVMECFKMDDKCIAIEEYVNGRQLESLIYENRLSVDDIIEYGEQICNALQPIHKKGIIHRDIQPKNIIVTREGVLKLIDFDIAREKKENVSHDTNFFGTVGYASPEQYGFAQTDCRSDIYSIGVLLREMITGSRNGSNEIILQKVLQENLIYNTKTNAKLLVEIIDKCTQIDFNNRYENIDQLRMALNESRGGTGNSQENDAFLRKNDDNAPQYKKNSDCLRKDEINELPKLTVKNVIRSIPGFKNGNAIFELLATFVYVILIVIFGKMGLEVEVTGAMKVYSVIMYLALFFVPYLYLGNIGQIVQRFPKRKFQSKVERVIFQVLYFLILFFIIICIIAFTLPPLSTKTNGVS